MDIVLRVITLKKLKLGYPVKLSKNCQLRTPKPYKGKIYVVWFNRNSVDIGL